LGCSAAKKSGNNTCFEELKTAAAGNWHYKKECNCYEGTQKFYDKFNASRSCLLTLDAKQIKSILGEPTGAPITHGLLTTYIYRLAPCETGKCVSFYFAFDTTMKVKNFMTGTETISTDH
jgi:hypothetical protein